ENFIIDTQVSDFTAELESDSGRDSSFTSDNVTNELPLVFSGSAEEGSTIVIAIDGYSYQAVFDSTDPTSWNVTISEEFLVDGQAWSDDYTLEEDGEYDYQFTVIDSVGNQLTSTTSADSGLIGNGTELSDLTGTVTLDQSVALDAELSADSSVDTGLSQTDGITQTTSPTFTGVTELDASIIITIKQDGQVVETYSFDNSQDAAANNAQLSVSDEGEWSYTIDDVLADGEYTVEIDATDIAGNQSDTVTDALIIDNSATLVVEGISAATDSAPSEATEGDARFSDQLTNITPSLEGTADANAEVTITLTAPDNSQIELSTTADANGVWSLDLQGLTELESAGLLDTNGDLAQNGRYSYQVSSVDVAGNESNSASAYFEFDSTAQSGVNFSGGLAQVEASDSGLYLDDGITTAQSPTFDGYGEVGASVSLTIENVGTFTAVTDSDGYWSIDLADEGIVLAESAYDYQLSLTDDAGNSASLAEQTVVVDLTNSANATAELEDSEESDTGSYNSDDYTANPQPVFTGTVDETANVVFSLYQKNEDGEIIDVHSYELGEISDSWSFDLSTTDYEMSNSGNYYYSVTSTDLAGNTLDSSEYSFTLDLENTLQAELDATTDTGSVNGVAIIDGTSTTIALADKTTNDAELHFSGSGEAGDTVVIDIYDADNNKVDSTTITLAGTRGDGSSESWSFDSSALLDQSDTTLVENFTYQISSVDLAGNTTTYTGSVTVDQTIVTTLTAEGLTDESDSEPAGSAEQNDDITYLTPVLEGEVGDDAVSVSIVLTHLDGEALTSDESERTYTGTVVDG
ncbi:Ig-like domain-containing protein, partial [Vibrio sp. TH_r3]|uniref:Ig-like domain-containing protein n=1 Tax=Vibrio sp. TH_r3 TaxID=3082084 RepID=UPI002952C37E